MKNHRAYYHYMFDPDGHTPDSNAPICISVCIECLARCTMTSCWRFKNCWLKALQNNSFTRSISPSFLHSLDSTLIFLLCFAANRLCVWMELYRKGLLLFTGIVVTTVPFLLHLKENTKKQLFTVSMACLNNIRRKLCAIMHQRAHSGQTI